jgi:hypothetical protein
MGRPPPAAAEKGAEGKIVAFVFLLFSVRSGAGPYRCRAVGRWHLPMANNISAAPRRSNASTVIVLLLFQQRVVIVDTGQY